MQDGGVDGAVRLIERVGLHHSHLDVKPDPRRTLPGEPHHPGAGVAGHDGDVGREMAEVEPRPAADDQHPLAGLQIEQLQ